ncbi:MAG TPA: DUF2905 domain-containing protein [Gammaproteobacteria bacterium]|nr:DUF2905 domain-containing protein [Gammaproteobacteria bacterium]HCZ47947.1 DUF2905 domain-containing protein [Gammaproteobacteria bacterium]MCH77385.1 DUF2905 domain-containing protein [Gammaproteobacteria bacterium]
MQKTLIVLGISLLVAGLAWPWLGAIPFGRLPGDIVIQRGNVRFYFPLTTMVVVSGVLSLLVWFLRR